MRTNVVTPSGITHNCGMHGICHGARAASSPARNLKAKEHGHAQRVDAQAIQTSRAMAATTVSAVFGAIVGAAVGAILSINVGAVTRAMVNALVLAPVG